MDCYSLIEKQREGLIKPDKARYRLRGLLHSKVIQESMVTLPRPPTVITCDFDCDNNLLIAAHSTCYVTIHDLRGVLKNSLMYGTLWKCDFEQQISALRRSKSVAFNLICVNWIQSNAYFTITGNYPHLICIDTNTVQLLDAIRVPNATKIYQHRPQPQNQSIVAIASSGFDVFSIDLRTGAVCQTKPGHSYHVQSVAWSYSDDYILASAAGSEIFLWDIRMTKHWITLYNDETRSDSVVPELQFVPGMNHLVGQTSTKELYIWDIFSLKRKLIRHDLKIHKDEFRHKFSIAGFSSPEILFLPQGNAIEVINLESMDTLSVLNGHIYSVRTTEFNHMKNELYSSAKDGNIVWGTCNPE